jgi:hypothetical protein
MEYQYAYIAKEDACSKFERTSKYDTPQLA